MAGFTFLRDAWLWVFVGNGVGDIVTLVVMVVVIVVVVFVVVMVVGKPGEKSEERAPRRVEKGDVVTENSCKFETNKI